MTDIRPNASAAEASRRSLGGRRIMQSAALAAVVIIVNAVYIEAR